VTQVNGKRAGGRSSGSVKRLYCDGGRKCFQGRPGLKPTDRSGRSSPRHRFHRLGGGSFSLILDGKTYNVEESQPQTKEIAGFNAVGELSRLGFLSLNGNQFVVRVDDERSLLVRSLLAKPQISSEIQIIRAPMPGLISRIEVAIGEEVASGKGLLVLEAMKMENEIRSLRHGRVESIHVERGKPVEKGEPLVTIAGI